MITQLGSSSSQVPNEEQLKAIESTTGPSLIIAGAGTGKTFVLTEKIKRLVLNEKIPLDSILALTFTEKSALEMEERVDRALPYGYFQTWILTFHSFADRILREYGLHIGISPSYKILTATDTNMFFENNLSKFKLDYFYSTGNPTGFVQSALQHFSRLRDENIHSADYKKYASTLLETAETEEEKLEAEKYIELSNLYADFEQIKLKDNYLDFSDLVYYANLLLKKRPNVLKELQSRFKYMLVDEFQDTNIVQYEIIKNLLPTTKNPNLTVIGDDNQSIYKFRGASVSNILSFMKDYKQAKMFVLNTNYRSCQTILDSAYKLIINNNPDTLESKLGISKKLVANSGNDKDKTINISVYNNSEEEAEKIVVEILKLVEKEKFTYADIAILVRANDHTRPIVNALERHRIPFQFLGPALLYYKNEVRDLIALLNFVNDPFDSVSLYRVLSMFLFNVNQKDLLLLNAYARKVSLSLHEVLDLITNVSHAHLMEKVKEVGISSPLLSEITKNNIGKVKQLLDELIEKSVNQSAPQTIYNFLDLSGYLKILSATTTSEADVERLNNITKFFDKLKKMEGKTGEVTVREAVASINYSLELGDSPALNEEYEATEAVSILTVHAAKGLEFPVVFMPSLVSERFPTRNRAEKLVIPEGLIKEILPIGDSHLQEERRLFYVGITRAKQKIYFSYANYYGTFKRRKKASPFIIEALGEDEVNKVVAQKEDEKKQLSIFSAVENEKVVNKTVIKTVTKPKKHWKLSYSQIELYRRCPKQYQYRYIIKLPEPESSALAFGSSVHLALELFYRDIKEGKEADKADLLNYFKENFISYGYQSRFYQNKAKKHGEQILSSYYDSFHNQRGQVIEVEHDFSLKLNSNGEDYVIRGKIDRIDLKGNTVEIIDYKTGKMPKPSELKRSLQLNIYALAFLETRKNTTNNEELQLCYHYLDVGEGFCMKANSEKLEKAKTDIATVFTNMQKEQYGPNKGYHCSWCPFKIVCPAWDK
jgi:DNA helicase-2/ATP-dependent DNA helicase PcrA